MKYKNSLSYPSLPTNKKSESISSKKIPGSSEKNDEGEESESDTQDNVSFNIYKKNQAGGNQLTEMDYQDHNESIVNSENDDHILKKKFSAEKLTENEEGIEIINPIEKYLSHANVSSDEEEADEEMVLVKSKNFSKRRRLLESSDED